MPVDQHHGLPTPRTTLRAGYVEVIVRCKGGCLHRAPADLRKLLDTGRGDVTLIHLKYGCSNCGSRRTGRVVNVER